MELKEYILPLRKWWWLIVAATLVATVASFLATRQQPPIYQSRTSRSWSAAPSTTRTRPAMSSG